jgi:hypothetical protein
MKKPNRLLNSLLAPSASVLFMAMFLVFGSAVHAGQVNNTYGSPLDTLTHTKLWADVPEAKGFVHDTRPPDDTLSYQPVTGTDPERPKLRSKAELKALESELESATAQNEKKAGKHGAVKNPAPSATKTVKSE